MTQAIFEFDAAWEDLCYRVATGKLQLPDDTPLPTPADVAGVLYEAIQDPIGQREHPAWVSEMAGNYKGRIRQLVDRLVEGGGAERGIEINGYPYGYTIPTVEGDDPIDDRLTEGFILLHLVMAGMETRAADDPDGGEAALTQMIIAGLEAIQRLWECVDNQDLKHPLAALIEGWLIGDPVEADGRETGILPATLAAVREADGPAALFDLGEYEKAPGFTPHPIAQAYLPGLAPVGDEIAPAMPLLMWDASTEGGPRPGKAAPLPLRIWIEAVLALPTADRFGIRRPVAVRFGDLVDWLMPNGEYRQRVFPAIRQALHRVHNLRLPWELPDGTGGSRAVVVVRDAPRVWNAYADMVTFEISLPPGVNAHGPIVYRPALRRLGQQSAMRYRANLGLSWLWDRYGARNGRYIQPTRPRIARDDQDRQLTIEGEIIPDKRGAPARTYTVPARRNGKTVRIERPGIVPLDADGRPVPTLADAAHERNPAADRYPVLTPAQLVELCYPLDLAGKKLTPGSNRKRRERAQDAIRLMAAEGYCIVEDADGGFRILPPSGWGAGYGG